MSAGRERATGHVRLVEGKTGPVFYAALRLPGGRRMQRKLGRAWLSRSRPPAGHITRSQAEAKLEAILSGADDSVPIRGTGVTFGQIAESWFAYVRDDRKRRPSTVADYRRELDHNLIPGMGKETPAAAITTHDIDAYRERLVAEGRLSPRSINKRLVQLHAIFKRAQRVYGLSSNPAAGAERQPEPRSGDIRTCGRMRSSRSLGRWRRPRTPHSSASPPTPACGSANCGRCAGTTSTGCAASST